MYKIAHIINPVLVSKNTDLYTAQPITFESMRSARKYAEGSIDVSLFTAQYAEDHPVLPDEFIHTPDLEYSVLDYGDFRVKRKLPLIADILGRLYEASDAEYFIYTNTDISLMPSFYSSVAALIDAGFDAFIINRRTISTEYRTAQQLPRMYAEVGQSHPGYDCFVFRRDALQKYMLGKICVGVPKIGIVLAANMVCFSDNFKECKNMHLTFHIGDDGEWVRHGADEYFQHNKTESARILNALAPDFSKTELPEVGLPALSAYFTWLRTGKTIGS